MSSFPLLVVIFLTGRVAPEVEVVGKMQEQDYYNYVFNVFVFANTQDYAFNNLAP